MRFLRSSLVILALIPALCSCNKGVSTGRSVVPLVAEIVSGRESEAHLAVDGFNPRVADGDIVVFGSADQVRAYCRALGESDFYDNVDARPIADALPDFSGEVITGIFLNSRTPLRAFLGGREETLSEMTVRSVICSIDTLSYSSPYDLTSYSHKTKGKTVVLANPEMAAYGKYDVDSLFRAMKNISPVVSPLELMADKVFADSTASRKVGIVSDCQKEFFDEYFSHREDASHSSITVIPVSALGDSVDVVASAGLDALMIEDVSVCADSLAARYPGVEILDAKTELCKWCYKDLRTRNAFTHRVAYPKYKSYIALDSGDFHLILIDADESYLQD